MSAAAVYVQRGANHSSVAMTVAPASDAVELARFACAQQPQTRLYFRVAGPVSVVRGPLLCSIDRNAHTRRVWSARACRLHHR